ncbi:transcription elongation factor A protein 3 isoform X2 [Ornithorhynchus anatinus]|uniref:transcription elongation factor A protein 3 isoform X2 n=1 Tax=Ornithorhynchus anatinus TaxID=9258 RepID=UPI0010A818E3|nr:transcription elongation factor A protein 3 isoform X2 [Ornithorhynchus anatinus]
MGRQEELLRIAKKLEKMVSGDSAEGALELLKELSSCTMTIQLLQTTRIGVAVNAVRKRCPDQQVVALAKVLIKNWKRLLDSSGTPHRDKEASGEKEKKAKGHAAPSGHRPGAAATAPAGDDRGRSGVTPRHRDNGGKAKVEIPQSPSPPTSPTSPMPSPSLGSAGCLLAPCYLTGDSVRDKCVEMLAAVLKVDGDYKEFGVNCEQLASEIEDHIYQELKSTDMKYRNRVRSRISNLRDPRNPALRRSVLCGGIAASRIARMTAEEMASDELKELRNAMTLEAIREHQMAKTGGTTTDLFQCSKCKKKNCTYNQVQTRSADEPMTTFVLCNECGNRWKFC